MRTRSPTASCCLVLAALAASACGGGEGGEPGVETGAAPAPAAPAGVLSAAQLEKGIGPVTRVSMGPLDHELAEEGEELFATKCSACHRLDERYVGPPLGDVLERREPEFVMNMILNPGEMVEKHPVVREMLAQYYTPMPNQGLTEEEARAILEYLRQGTAES